MKVILLAGGLGTRLRPLTLTTPKPLIPIDHRNLTEHVFEIFKKHGVDEVIMSVGYKADEIKKYLGNGDRYGFKITYFVEGQPTGTAAPFLFF